MLQVFNAKICVTMGPVRTLATAIGVIVLTATAVAIVRSKLTNANRRHVRMEQHARIWLAPMPVTVLRASKALTVS